MQARLKKADVTIEVWLLILIKKMQECFQNKVPENGTNMWFSASNSRHKIMTPVTKRFNYKKMDETFSYSKSEIAV